VRCQCSVAAACCRQGAVAAIPFDVVRTGALLRTLIKASKWRGERIKQWER
jgi:hypothetical protein